MSVWIVVPCNDRHQYLPSLAANCGIPADQIVVVRGPSRPPAYIPGAHHLEQPPGINIHHWWNMGINYAQEHGASKTLVVNDDITFNSSLIPTLSAAMDATGSVISFPDRGNGDTRFDGACWLLDLSSDVRPDERFKWWYGDNDLEYQTNGKITSALVGYTHHHPNALTENNPILLELIRQDEITFKEKWGNR